MAVQMTASSTQDLMTISTGADLCSVQAKGSGAGAFESELTAFAKKGDAQPQMQHSDDRPLLVKIQSAERRMQQTVKHHDAPSAIDAGDAAVEAEIDQGAVLTKIDLTVMLAPMGDDGDAPEIEQMIAQLEAEKALTTGRFDPDAILGVSLTDIVPETDSSDDESDELGRSAEEVLASALLSEVVSAVSDMGSKAVDVVLADEDAAEYVVGQTGDGEIAMKFADEKEQLTADELFAAGDLAKTAQDGASAVTEPHIALDLSAKPHADGEPAPAEQQIAGPAQLAGAVAETPKASDAKRLGAELEQIGSEGPDSSDVDAKFAELIARFKEERDQRAHDRGAGDRSDGAKLPQVNAKRSGQTQSAVRRAAESSHQTKHDPRADSANAREIPFSETLSSRLREAAQSAFAAEETSTHLRSGMTYSMAREAAFTDGLGTVLEFMKTDGTHEARIVVEPPALGHIDISLRASESGMQAAFKVDSEHLKQMVQQHIDILKSSLESQGIHVSNIAVDIRNKDDQNGHGAAHAGKGKKGKGASGPEADGEEEAESVKLVRLDLEQGLLHWIG